MRVSNLHELVGWVAPSKTQRDRQEPGCGWVSIARLNLIRIPVVQASRLPDVRRLEARARMAQNFVLTRLNVAIPG